MPTDIRSPLSLLAAGLVRPDEVDPLKEVGERYPIAITGNMAELIDRDDPNDPIARQFVPSAGELNVQSHEQSDPVGDDIHSPVFGLIHRHPDRVLLKVTGICPVYCRFCFRREMIGPQAKREMTSGDVRRAADYVRNRTGITEVIFTGGDPFILAPEKIRMTAATFSAIPHVRVLRWHTRVPVVAPAKVTDALVSALTSEDSAVFVAVHANHAREFTQEARDALRRLSRAGMSLISQSVLLRGVNDNISALTDLMMAFVAAGVKPYYLHHPDLAPGTSHLRVSLKKGMALTNELRRSVTGLAQPTYVLDIPGGIIKVPVTEATSALENGTFQVEDPFGNVHLYSDPL
jgi:lysine 2,3-aminomutase